MRFFSKLIMSSCDSIKIRFGSLRGETIIIVSHSSDARKSNLIIIIPRKAYYLTNFGNDNIRWISAKQNDTATMYAAEIEGKCCLHFRNDWIMTILGGNLCSGMLIGERFWNTNSNDNAPNDLTENLLD